MGATDRRRRGRLGDGARRALGRFGLEVHRRPPAAGELTDPGERVVTYPPDYDEASRALFESVKHLTLTSHERVNALRLAVEYVVRAGVPGAVVECGVWRGGSMLAVAKTLLALGATDRDLHLFDTFEAMPRPGPEDVDVYGRAVSDYHDEAVAHPYYRFLPEDEVRAVLLDSGYPAERLHFVKGMVEDTIPEHAPATISLCRLDTDLYASTAHEMEHLFPRISPGGVLLLDDYGDFRGARRAVDEYLAAHGITLLLNRIDQGGRVAVLPAPGTASRP